MNAAAESAAAMDAAAVAATRGTVARAVEAAIGMNPVVVIRDDAVRDAVGRAEVVQVAVARVAAIHAVEEDMATRGARDEGVVARTRVVEDATRAGDTTAVSGKMSAGIGIMTATTTSSAHANWQTRSDPSNFTKVTKETTSDLRCASRVEWRSNHRSRSLML